LTQGQQKTVPQLEEDDSAVVKEKRDSLHSKEFNFKNLLLLREADKISKSIRIALRKRPIDSDSIEKFISKLVRNLEGLGESEIPTSTIGKVIMEGLSGLDQVAYVRFASVYKNFKEAKDFEQFVGNLNVYKAD
jgi:transcriptional regulator NrdR family protein